VKNNARTARVAVSADGEACPKPAWAYAGAGGADAESGPGMRLPRSGAFSGPPGRAILVVDNQAALVQVPVGGGNTADR
jgi:hypothetical protein